MNAPQYWVKLKLPAELIELNMKQLTALRRMIYKSFNEGKKSAAR